MLASKHLQRGFTLIELMIVIAIIGVLAAIALPAYQDHIVRSKMIEPLAALAEAKTAVAEYVAANGSYPADKSGFGIDNTERTDFSDVLWKVDVLPVVPETGDVIHLGAGVFTSVWDGTEKSAASVAVFQLSGSTNSDGTMTWECLAGSGQDGVAEVPVKYLPANCRG